MKSAEEYCSRRVTIRKFLYQYIQKVTVPIEQHFEPWCCSVQSESNWVVDSPEVQIAIEDHLHIVTSQNGIAIYVRDLLCAKLCA